MKDWTDAYVRGGKEYLTEGEFGYRVLALGSRGDTRPAGAKIWSHWIAYQLRVAVRVPE